MLCLLIERRLLSLAYVDECWDIRGTTIFYQSSVFNGRWFGFLAPFGLPRPGQTKTYMIVVARKADGTDAENEAFLNFAMDLEKKVVSEDVPILRTIHFIPGTLTKSDKALAKFMQYVRNYPRAHPSAEFIAYSNFQVDATR